MSAPEGAFSYLVTVKALPRIGRTVRVTAKPAQCAGIAEILKVPGVASLNAEVTVTPASGGRFKAEGVVKARVTQTCVVTLEDFSTDFEEAIDATFAAEEKLGPVTKKEVERSLSDEDPPEPLLGDAIDVAGLAVEFIALALDPFPRKPGVAFVGDEAPLPKENPFAILATLAKKP